ncbi:MAG: hypothetical protein Q9162_007105 [Coniocarpon cinnabarinum]
MMDRHGQVGSRSHASTWHGGNASPASPSPILIILLLILIYACIIRHFRHRRSQALPAANQFPDRQSYAAMTADQAQAILQELAELEFPRFYSLSIAFALFKTYAIPSVASLLVATRQLSNPKMMSKRLADTGALMLEMCLNPPSSARARDALARTNYLHSRYRANGKISDDDMLYTLSLFALEPVRWAKRVEWRSLTQLEVCAQGTLWKAIGDAMDIPFTAMPSIDDGWRDGAQWLEELQTWSEQYEERNLMPGEDQGQLAEMLIRHVVPNCPESMFESLRQVFAVAVGERVGQAMMLPRPSLFVNAVVHGTLLIRRMILQHFIPPRAERFRVRYISAEPHPESNKYNMRQWLTEPWYVRPTVETRYGFEPRIKVLMGARLPGGDDGNQFAPEGYAVSELGPEFEKGRGSDFMDMSKRRMEELSLGASPFHLSEEALLNGFLEKKE